MILCTYRLQESGDTSHNKAIGTYTHTQVSNIVTIIYLFTIYDNTIILKIVNSSEQTKQFD